MVLKKSHAALSKKAKGMNLIGRVMLRLRSKL
jgi:hypothetical protein